MDVKEAFEKGKRFILRELWGHELASLTGFRRALFHWMRTLSLAVHGFIEDKCALRAAALTLVFTFSLAPALAVGFSVAKGFHAQERIQPLIYSQLGLVDADGKANPDAAFIKDIFDKFLTYVAETNVEALGVIGILIMLYAAYRVLSSIETTMNHIWGVRRKRRLMRRVVDYTAVVTVSPIMLILTALVTASLQSQAVLNQLQGAMPQFLVHLLGVGVAVLLAVAALSFLYFFFPNTRVRPLSALAGAVVAAVLLQVLQYVYLKLQMGVAKYNAIYGTFAAIPIFLLWLHFSWLVVLFGAELSYAHANQRDLEFGGLTFSPSPAYRAQIALGVMALAGRAFLRNEAPPTCESMAGPLAAPMRVMRTVTGRLTGAGLLAELQGDVARFQPAAPLEQITVGRVLEAINKHGDESPQTLMALERLGVADVFHRQEQAESGLQGMTLADLARACNDPGGEAEATG